MAEDNLFGILRCGNHARTHSTRTTKAHTTPCTKSTVATKRTPRPGDADANTVIPTVGGNAAGDQGYWRNAEHVVCQRDGGGGVRVDGEGAGAAGDIAGVIDGGVGVVEGRVTTATLFVVRRLRARCRRPSWKTARTKRQKIQNEQISPSVQTSVAASTLRRTRLAHTVATAIGPVETGARNRLSLQRDRLPSWTQSQSHAQRGMPVESEPDDAADGEVANDADHDADPVVVVSDGEGARADSDDAVNDDPLVAAITDELIAGLSVSV